MNRRNFLRQLASATGAGGAAFAFGGFARRADALGGAAKNFSHLRARGFGALIPTATKNTGETFLALPRGFEYTVIGKTGSEMSDKNKTPRAHDGMAAFKVKGELRVIRNHEVTNGRIPKEGGI